MQPMLLKDCLPWGGQIILPCKFSSRNKFTATQVLSIRTEKYSQGICYFLVLQFCKMLEVCEYLSSLKRCVLLNSITAAEMAPFVEVLLTNLFKALTLPGSSENEYIMKGKCFVVCNIRVAFVSLRSRLIVTGCWDFFFEKLNLYKHAKEFCAVYSCLPACIKSSLTEFMVPRWNTKHNSVVANYFSNGILCSQDSYLSSVSRRSKWVMANSMPRFDTWPR